MKPLKPSEFAAPRPGLSRRRLLLGSLGVVAFAGAAPPAYALGIEAQRLIVTTYRPRLPGWPAGRRLTIAVVADLHAGGPNMGLSHIERVVETTNAQKADIILLLGDYFATHRFVTERVPHPAWAAQLAKLQAPLGVWAIFGNHDWWYDINGARHALRNVGIPTLDNDAKLLGEGGNRFWLAGLGDQIAIKLGWDRSIWRQGYRGVDDLPGTLARVTTDDPVILMVHEPDIFTKIPERVALTLAGHTHGGQIRIPGWERFVPSEYGARFAYGHIVEDGRHMIVSGGLGTSIVPARLGVPPEIVRIELGA
jgi:predicted MPP superfamily phosphohydrolase